MDNSERAQPLADKEFGKEIFDLVQGCSSLKEIKKGANEATKCLNRGIAQIIIIAADTTPLEIVLHLPLLCEDKNVPYIFVSSKKKLGQACGTSRNVIACAILKNENSRMKEKVVQIRNKAELQFINSQN
ncbi:hypothetical protein PPERSA_06135 [Pseudocohnilembus persalinus]|uniref:H/ACA ribonucleoprotein complex subunit 2 n=1 Tax=Pseudocohnilembus persalinus TaxID=266149 RepID=A0A0V0QVY1_PSEPJ|nr:hypothetical protein PPERSA_06135 [Pseudocohnilembus persalinus]|eukprot:KRX06253.1 hypothetical protein PPERSA_06135 [Pseudocohnilembus persalinus]